jgi:hypothetical protein
LEQNDLRGENRKTRVQVGCTEEKGNEYGQRILLQLVVRKIGCLGAEFARHFWLTICSVNRLTISEELVDLKTFLKMF